MSSPNHDAVEHVSQPLPEADIKEKPEIVFNEKNVNTGTLVELQDTPHRRLRPQNYVRSFQDVFTKQSMFEYWAVMVKFGRFIGPATIVSVAYIDPDNFQTSVSSGVQFEYKLLFMVLVSNLIAIFLQVSY